MHKAGFVNIVGNPNVGKSTLMNRILGEKLSIVSPKAQTTRQRIMGILSDEDYQIVFSDTPGILKPKYKMHALMLSYIENALSDADVLLYVTDADDTKRIENNEILQKIANLNIPQILVFNKIDNIKQQELDQYFEKWRSILPKATFIPASAMHNYNIDTIIKKILEFLPEHEPFFDKDNLSDRPMRFFVAELIREKIFLNYKQEIPYSTHVVVDSFKEFPTITKISATIYIERDSQKPIIIGAKGSALKKVGTDARKDIEKWLGTKIFLELYVKVDEDWRRKEGKLKNLGFEM